MRPLSFSIAHGRSERTTGARFGEAMANSVTNRLTIRGEATAVAALADAIRDPDDQDRPVAFERIVPQPDGLEGFELRNWRESHWGASYAPASATIERPHPGTAEELVFLFTSDGGAPVPLIVALASQHPDIEVELVYHEPADELAGRARFQEGRPVEAIRLYDFDDCCALLADVWPDELEFWQ